METINNVATAAAKAVWGNGDANKEPVSGASGDVSKGEPYDAGNLADPEQQNKLASEMAAADPTTPKTEKPPAGDTTDGQNDTRDPDEEGTIPADQLKGPGPKPLEALAKERGGDAGKSDEAIPGESAASEKKGDGDAVQLTPATAKGTGNEYVKSTGLAADGGDFDATKPGAGLEADRLMDKKGIQHGDANAAGAEPGRPSEQSSKPSTDASTSSPSTASKKKRMSLGARIKAKLHKN